MAFRHRKDQEFAPPLICRGTRSLMPRGKVSYVLLLGRRNVFKLRKVIVCQLGHSKSNEQYENDPTLLHARENSDGHSLDIIQKSKADCLRFFFNNRVVMGESNSLTVGPQSPELSAMTMHNFLLHALQPIHLYTLSPRNMDGLLPATNTTVRLRSA